jgi:ABC-type transport system involved in multi-copper enzyme maturation permease subunit
VRAARPHLREFGAAVATIMVKELRSRMRGRRAFVVLTVYLGVLALIAYGTYTVVSPMVRVGPGMDAFGLGMPATDASARIGQAIFTVLSLFQLLLVCFIAPAFTAGAISLEREKLTLDLLISTPLRPGAIVVGKLLAALAFVFLMILAAIPLSALVLMYGGAGVEDIIRQQIVLLVTALGLGTVGVFWSALLKRTQAATVLTYCTMLALTIGTLLLFVFWTALVANEPGRFGGGLFSKRAPEQIVYANPLVAMSDVIAVTEPAGFGDFTSVITELRGRRAGQLGAAANPDGLLAGHFWPRFAATFGALGLLLTAVSMRLVVPAGMRFVFRRRRRTRAIDDDERITVPGEGDATIEPIRETE